MCAPRHSKGNHAKYLSLSVVKASRLLLHTRIGKVLKVNTHILGEAFSHTHTHHSYWPSYDRAHGGPCVCVVRHVLVVSVLKSEVRKGP